jgi:hypothetical protein
LINNYKTDKILKGNSILKKNMLLILAIGCAINNIFASPVKSSGRCGAFKLGLYPRFDTKDVPSTKKINGIDVSDIVHSLKKMDPDKVFVVEALDENRFSESKELSEFSQTYLWYYYYGRGKKFVDDDHHYVAFIESLYNNTCYLCIDTHRQVVILNAYGKPQDVCNRLKAAKIRFKQDPCIVQAQADKNAGMSSRAYAREKASE